MKCLYTVGLVIKRTKDLGGGRQENVLELSVYTGLFESETEAGVKVTDTVLKDNHPDFEVEKCEVFRVPDYAVFEASRELASGGKK